MMMLQNTDTQDQPSSMEVLDPNPVGTPGDGFFH